MKPQSRMRKTIKWGGAAATLLLAAVWIASIQWAFEFHPTSHTCVATGGVGVIIVGWIGSPQMTEQEWKEGIAPPAEARPGAYEAFMKASPFSPSFFGRNDGRGVYKPPLVWIWPWKTTTGSGTQETSRYVFVLEASLPSTLSYSRFSPYWRFSVLLWPLVLVCGTVTALAWWFHLLMFWRARPGFCRRCRYDLTGLAPGAVCPECGAQSAPSLISDNPHRPNSQAS